MNWYLIAHNDHNNSGGSQPVISIRKHKH